MTDAVQSCTLRAARNHQRPAMEGWSGAGSLKTWGCLIDTNKEPAINNSSMKGGIPDAGITIATITRRQRWTQEGSIIDTGLTAKQIPTGNIFSSFTFIKKKKKKKKQNRRHLHKKGKHHGSLNRTQLFKGRAPSSDTHDIHTVAGHGQQEQFVTL